MAVNSNEDIDTELIKNPDMMLLAKNVVDCMLLLNLQKNSSKLNQIQLRDHINNAFAPIAKAFCFLDNSMENEHDDLYRELKKGNFINLESYEIFAKTLATEYFSEGFDAKYFLIYCVNLMTMEDYFYINGIIGVRDLENGIGDVSGLAKSHIYHCLKEYDMSDGRWDAIYTIAKNYEKMLLDSKNELTSPDISLVSDKIKHQDQEQEEASEDSNSLQIEEQNVSSVNEESNLEQLKESAHSFHCSSENQKYTLYSSKSRSDTALCSLKEPESFSEDTSPSVTLEENKAINRLESDNEETPDTSNVDQGLILIISDFKKKMDLLWNEIKNGE